MFFDFFAAHLPPKNYRPVVTCNLLIHAICALFEVNQLRNTSVIGEKPSKTSKIGCFSNFYGPLTPPKNYRLEGYMQLVNTRILRHFWSRSVEKHQCYRRKTLKNVKNRVFFEFLRPPRPKIKNRASLGHAPLQYATFEGSLKKIGWETKKFMQNNVWSWPSSSHGDYSGELTARA